MADGQLLCASTAMGSESTMIALALMLDSHD